MLSKFFKWLRKEKVVAKPTSPPPKTSSAPAVSPPPPKSKPTYAYVKPNGQVVTVTPNPMDDLTTYMLMGMAFQPAEPLKPAPASPSVYVDPTPSYRSEVSSGSDFSSDYSGSSDSGSSSFGD